MSAYVASSPLQLGSARNFFECGTSGGSSSSSNRRFIIYAHANDVTTHATTTKKKLYMKFDLTIYFSTTVKTQMINVKLYHFMTPPFHRLISLNLQKFDNSFAILPIFCIEISV